MERGSTIQHLPLTSSPILLHLQQTFWSHQTASPQPFGLRCGASGMPSHPGGSSRGHRPELHQGNWKINETLQIVIRYPGLLKNCLKLLAISKWKAEKFLTPFSAWLALWAHYRMQESKCSSSAFIRRLSRSSVSFKIQCSQVCCYLVSVSNWSGAFRNTTKNTAVRYSKQRGWTIRPLILWQVPNKSSIDIRLQASYHPVSTNYSCTQIPTSELRSSILIRLQKHKNNAMRTYTQNYWGRVSLDQISLACDFISNVSGGKTSFGMPRANSSISIMIKLCLDFC